MVRVSSGWFLDRASGWRHLGGDQRMAGLTRGPEYRAGPYSGVEMVLALSGASRLAWKGGAERTSTDHVLLDLITRSTALQSCIPPAPAIRAKVKNTRLGDVENGGDGSPPSGVADSAESAAVLREDGSPPS